MEIVACSPKIDIVYMPSRNSVIERNNCNTVTNGQTFGPEERIFIAVGDYNDNSKLFEIMGLIIHEFCHFAIYKTFSNAYEGFYVHDHDRKAEWKEVIEECRINQGDEFLITNAFKCYVESKMVEELVVRYFQFQVEYQNNSEKLENFKTKFPKLINICDNYVLENFKSEYEKIRAVGEINRESGAISESDETSPYNVKAVSYKLLHEIDFKPDLQVVRTNQTFLVTNSIFHEFKNEKQFESKYVFVSLEFSKTNNLIEKLKLIMDRRCMLKIVIDCDFEEYNDIIFNLKPVLYSKKSNCKIMILLNKNQQNYFSDIQKINLQFSPIYLTDKLVEMIKLNFQNREILLKDLISVTEFKSLNVLPATKILKDIIEIGNQMKIEMIHNYIEREFSIETRKNKWVNFDNIKHILETHRRILLTNEPGAGKSTESVKMYYRFKETYPDHWIVHTNLSDFYSVLNEEKDLENMEDSLILNFLCLRIFKFTEFERQIFDYLVQKGKVILIFDSLDEIAPLFLEFVKKFIDEIFQSFKEQRIVIVTRPHLAEKVIEFKFVNLKLKKLSQNKKRELISKILQEKYEDESKLRKKQKFVEDFLRQRDFHTPLLIEMVTTISSFENDDLTLYDIYDKFIDEFKRGTDKKNLYVEKTRRSVNRIMDEYFQNYAIQKISDKFVYENVFKIFYFADIKEPDRNSLQRMGVIHFDIKSNFRFIHESFEDFYIAEFIKKNIKEIYGEPDHKNALLDIFSKLLSNDRLKNVIDFMSGSSKVAEHLREYDVLAQMQRNEKFDKNSVNIMKVIHCLKEIIENNSNFAKECANKNIFSSTILFSDPLKILERLDSICWSKYSNNYYFVNENIFIRNDGFEKMFLTFADCSTKHNAEYFVSSKKFEEYFKKLTYQRVELNDSQHFDLLQCKISFKDPHNTKIKIKTFLNFCEQFLFEVNDPNLIPSVKFTVIKRILLLAFNPIHNDYKRLLTILKKLSVKLGQTTGDMLKSYINSFCSEEGLGQVILQDCSNKITEIKLKGAFDFVIEAIDNKEIMNELLIDKKCLLLFEALYSEHKFALKVILTSVGNNLVDKSFWQNFLLVKNSDELTIFQMILGDIDIIEDQVECIVESYNLHFGEEQAGNEFSKQLSEKVFFDKFVDCISGIYDEQKLENLKFKIEKILEFLKSKKAFLKRQDTRGWTILMVIQNRFDDNTLTWFTELYRSNLGSEVIDLFIKNDQEHESFIKNVSFKNYNSIVRKLLMKIIEEYEILSECFPIMYQLFSSENMEEETLKDLIREILLKFTLNESNYEKLLNKGYDENSSTLLIAAAKNKLPRRVEIFFEIFEYFDKDKIWKSFSSRQDQFGKTAEFYMRENSNQLAEEKLPSY